MPRHGGNRILARRVIADRLETWGTIDPINQDFPGLAIIFNYGNFYQQWFTHNIYKGALVCSDFLMTWLVLAVDYD